jgi:hypothetical protein
MFPPAFDLLGEFQINSDLDYFLKKKTFQTVKRQDIFGSVGYPTSLIDKVVDFSQAAESYRAFDKGEVGKVIFDPWK